MRCPDGANNIQSSQYQIKHGLLWDPKSSHPLGENHTESPWQPKTLPNTPLGYVTQISCILTCFGFIQALLEAKIGRFCLILDPQMVLFTSSVLADSVNHANTNLFKFLLNIMMMMMTFHCEHGSERLRRAESRRWKSTLVQKGMSFITPILMHGVC